MVLRKIGSKPHHLIFAQPVNIAQAPLQFEELDTCRHDSLKKNNGFGTQYITDVGALGNGPVKIFLTLLTLVKIQGLAVVFLVARQVHQFH